MFMLYPTHIMAMDHVRFEKGQSAYDTRGEYKEALLRLALEHTVEDYGPYQFTTDAPWMNTLQAKKQLQTGEQLNVFIAVTTPEWEQETLAIKIPVRKGLLNYRLLLIHKDDQALFENITKLEELKALSVGLLHNWSITTILENQGFNIKRGSNYDGLFQMLDFHRFHYIPRGVNEIFSELEQRKAILSNVIIAPNIALYIPTPSYIFVSPQYPRLAKRLEEGLEKIIQNGNFERLFQEHFSDNIKSANLNQRIILKLDESEAMKNNILERPEIWFTPK
jgi:hypothetical protein